MNLDEIPPEIHDAAKLIQSWMKEQGVNRWEFGGICSRNYAERARKLEEYSRHGANCIKQGRLTGSCDCGLVDLLS